MHHADQGLDTRLMCTQILHGSHVDRRLLWLCRIVNGLGSAGWSYLVRVGGGGRGRQEDEVSITRYIRQRLMPHTPSGQQLCALQVTSSYT